MECPKLDRPLMTESIETADICLGWFWGPDYFFSNLDGVIDVTVGYSGGIAEFPTYKSIKDYTEAVRVVFDKRKLSYQQILELFFDQQGGPPTSPSFSRQYRSALLVHNEDQRIQAQAMVQNFAKVRRVNKIYTDIEDSTLTDFYRAEEYHQKFMEKQGRSGRY